MQVVGDAPYREPFMLPIGHLGVIYDSQLRGYALLFIAIRIRVKVQIRAGKA